MDFPIAFTKMSGTGNDFIVIDHRRPFLAGKNEMSAFARAVCRRKFSAGADGLILIEDSEEADFRWQFYNGDGSEAEMCGNGARCAARFAHSKNIAPATMSFATVAGLIRAEVTDHAVKIEMTPPFGLALDQKIVLGGAPRRVDSLNTGVPHAVCFVEDNASTPVQEWGSAIRFHEMFMPAGTNANFVEIKGTDALYVRTYERGVEGETMACGTGAVAAAIIAAIKGRVQAPVKVTTSGGEELVIHFILQSDRTVKGVYLEGPAHVIYEGLLQPEAMK